MVIDGLDRDVLRLLQEDARRSHREIARLTGSTGPTVAARLARMEDIGIIQGYTVRIDAERFDGGQAGDEPRIDLAATVRVPCHECRQPTADPRWWAGDGRRHPFCCPTCEATFIGRYERRRRGA